jgi:MFS family permease
MLAAAMIGGAIFQIPLGRASDRMDRRHVMIFAGMLGLVLSFSIALFGTDIRFVFFALAFLLGSVLFPIYALNVAHANDHAEQDAFVEVSSGLLIVYGGGTMVGPLAVGAFMDATGPSALFVAIGTAFGTYGAYALYRISRRAKPKEEERTDFQAIPIGKAQTPQTYALDPRVDATPETEGVAAG